MKEKFNLTALSIALLLGLCVSAQDFSNKGRDFWVAYGYHQVMTSGNQQQMVLYFATDAVTTVTVEILGIGYIRTYSNIPANTVFQSDPIPKVGSQDARLLEEGIFDLGIHITSNKPIVAYTHIYNQSVSGATLLFPTPTLGKEYFSINYDQISNTPDANCWFYAIAVDTGITNIEIIPSQNTLNHNAGVPFTVSLTQGQVVNMMGQLTSFSAPYRGVDLTGSSIKSISGPGGNCKRIAVFSGSGRISVSCNGSTPSSDNYIAQAFPKNAWGKKYLTVPTGTLPNNFFRICVSNPATVVKINGVTTTNLINNFYYQFSSNQPAVIESDQPVMVAQYITSQGQCSNQSPGDPEVIYLSPIEQIIDKVILNSAQNFAITEHWINVIIKASVAPTFKIDGFPVSFTPHPQDPSYVYAQIGGTFGSLTAGQHILTADSGFNAIAYGYGNAESYGYNAGTNVRDLYQFVSISNPLAIVNFPATCAGTPFYLSMTFPYQPTEIKWLFNGLFPDVTLNNPLYDSTWIVNGKQLYRYKLPTAYNTFMTGTVPIKVIAQNPTPDGCGNEQEINYDLQIFDRPVANFNFATNGCVSNPVSFIDNSFTNGRPITKWNWSFDDGGISALQNPTHTYPAAGSYLAKLSVVTDIGCLSDTVANLVNLTQSPSAKFGAAGPFCIGNTVTFTDSSSSPASALAKWIWNFGDGSPVVTATTNAPQTHVYGTAGTFYPTLEVETASGCKSGVFKDTLVIGNKPVAAFTFGNGCLPNATVQFTDGSTINGGAGTFTYAWSFGDGGTSTIANPVHTYTTAGPFTATLTVTSAGGCTDDESRSISTIFAQPQAVFSASSAESCLGQAITFTDNSSAPNSTVTQWIWNFGDGSPVVTAASNAPQTHTYPTPGNYTVKLYVKSAIGCFSDTTPLAITVLPLPLASFTASTLRCEGDAIQFVSTSVANSGTVDQYRWFVNNVLSGSAATFSYTPPAAGVVAIKLSITTSKGCIDDTTINVTVHPKPAPDFTLPNICLPSGSGQFNNQTTISDGTISSVTYIWNFGDGTPGSTAINPVHVYSAAGPFAVNLIATSNNGCAKSITKQLTTVYPQPQAAFQPPAEVCLGNAVTLTDNSTAPNSTVSGWLWTFDDATTQTTQTAIKTFATPGTHTFTLQVTSAIGCVSTIASGSVTVNRLPTARFTLGTPSCEKKDIQFNDASVANSGSIVKWTWDMGDGLPPTDKTPPFTYYYATPNPYDVKLVVQTNKGCISTPAFDSTILVSPSPAAGFAMPENCLTDPISQFTDTSKVAGGMITGWLWNFGDPNATAANPNTATNQHGSHKYTAATNYNVVLTVTSDKGCASSKQQTMTVNGAVPEAKFIVAGGTEQCSNQQITITNNSGVDFGNLVKLEIFWDNAGDQSNKVVDEDPQAGKTYKVSYPAFFTPATKNYVLRVRAYSGEQCFDDSLITIQLNAIPEILFTALKEVCADVPAFQLNASVTNISGNFVWSGAGVSSTGIFNPAAAGFGTHQITYQFTGTNTCVDLARQTIEVNPVPIVDAGPSIPLGVLEGGSVTIPATASGQGLQYLWTPAIWLNNNKVLRPVASPLRDTTYRLTVTTSDGCVASDQVFIRVLKNISIPNVFSPNGDGIHDKWEITYLESYQGASVQVYNRYGQLIFQSKGYSRPWDGTINGNPVPIGTYYYIIDPKNGRKQIAGFVDIIR